jgi:hypothetical protein
MNDTTICTYTGNHVDLSAPSPEVVNLDDIASSLGKLARFNGHTSAFYSVASHSLLVAIIAERVFGGNPYLRLVALLHDGAEAYLGDACSPVRRLSAFAPFNALMAEWEKAVFSAFGADRAAADDAIKRAAKFADWQALLIEERAYMGGRLIIEDKTIHPAVNHLDPETMFAPVSTVGVFKDAVTSAAAYVRRIGEKGIPAGDPHCFCLRHPYEKQTNGDPVMIVTSLCPSHGAEVTA